jgi:hypothetical protein
MPTTCMDPNKDQETPCTPRHRPKKRGTWAPTACDTHSPSLEPGPLARAPCKLAPGCLASPGRGQMSWEENELCIERTARKTVSLGGTRVYMTPIGCTKCGDTQTEGEGGNHRRDQSWDRMQEHFKLVPWHNWFGDGFLSAPQTCVFRFEFGWAC